MRSKFLAAALGLASLAPAAAHVTITDPNAPRGGAYVATFKVGHGCSGSPTVALRIAIPEGVGAVAPQPRGGWTAKVEYTRATPHHGKRAAAIVWKGAPLAPDHPSEFMVKMKLPSSGTFVFPTTQTCASGVESWSETAGAAGAAPSHHPAPVIYVGAAQTPAAVAISDAWMRFVPAGNPAGGYFTLRNSGDKPLTLVGASSSACGMLMMHQTQMINGISHMADVGNIPVPAGGTLQFAPGGYHLMCVNPGPAIKPGSTIDVTLEFAGGAKITALFPVRDGLGR